MKINTKSYKLKEINSDLASSIASKYNLKEDSIEFIRKGIAIDSKSIDEDKETGLMYISTKHTDRDGDIVVPGGVLLDDYRKTPVVLWCHDYHAKDVPLGMNQWIKVDSNGLLAKTKFHTRPGTLGEKVYNYLKDGFPLACSIGFVVLESVEKDSFHEINIKKLGLDEKDVKTAKQIFTKTILLEYSLVNVASNQDSVVLSMKNFGLDIDNDYVYHINDIEIEQESSNVQEKSKEAKAEETESGTISSSEEKEMISEFQNLTSELETMSYILSDEEVDTLVKSYEQIEGYTDESELDFLLNQISSKSDISPIDEIVKSIENEEIKSVSCTCPECGATSEFENSCGMCSECNVQMESSSEDNDEDDKGCGGKRKPKKSFYEEIINDYSKMIPEMKSKAIENKEINTKLYDVASVPSSTSSRKMKIYCKFLECKIKDVYQNEFLIPPILNGAYLAGFKNAVKNYKELDVRNFGHHEEEYPPSYEVVKINSKIEDDFLTDGQAFYDFDGVPIVLDFFPTWSGQMVTISSSRKDMETNKSLIKSVHNWVEKENPLKNEKFGLSKDFIEVDEKDTWDTILLSPENTKTMKITEKRVKEKSDFAGRGILLVGPPGTGKTKVSRILMTQTDKTFIWVSSKDLQDDWSVNGKIAFGFKLARQLAPTVILFEDIDGWINGKIVDLFKTELDGLKKNTGVVTILTTNNPEKLPDALLDRPGRFHDVLEFGYPTKEIRKEMFSKWVDDIDEKTIEILLDSTDGYSGAHMWELIEFAKSIAEDEEISMSEAILQSLDKLSAQKDLINTIRGKSIESADPISIDELSEASKRHPLDGILEIDDMEIVNQIGNHGLNRAEKSVFPIEIEEKQIETKEYSDEEIEEMVLRVLEDGITDINTAVQESIARLKGKMFI